MYSIKNMTVTDLRTMKNIVENFSYEFQDNQIIGLIGEEGSGKSTVIKGICNPDTLKNVNINIEGRTKGAIIGYVPQQIYFEGTVYQYIYDNVDYFDYGKYYMLIDLFNFPDVIGDERLFNVLSGGEQTKLTLIKVFMMDADILFLDEPTNNLDIKTMEVLENYLNSIRIPVVFASHDTIFLENLANTIIHFEQIKRRTESRYTVYPMGYQEFVRFRDQQINRQESLAVKEKEEFDKAVKRYERVHDRVHHELNAVSRQDPVAAKNLKDKMRSVKSIEKKLGKQEEQLQKKPEYETAIQFVCRATKNVHNTKRILEINYPILEIGDKELSKDIILSIYGPTKVAIIGKNGVGKTTLLKRILKEFPLQGIKYGWMPQNYESVLDINLTPIELLCDVRDKAAVTQTMTFLGSLNFKDEEMQEPLHKLSGGQQTKIFFANMAMVESDILVLDEPTRNISPLSSQTLIQSLNKFEGAILAVTHDRKLIKEVFDVVYELTDTGLVNVSTDFLE